MVYANHSDKGLFYEKNKHKIHTNSLLAIIKKIPLHQSHT